MPTHDCKQETTFYEEVQKAEDLDLRDNRGKIHDLPFVLLGVILASLIRIKYLWFSIQIKRLLNDTYTPLRFHRIGNSPVDYVTTI